MHIDSKCETAAWCESKSSQYIGSLREIIHTARKRNFGD